MHHGFDIDLAKKYGVLPAIMLEYIAHWVIYNRSLNQNRVNGKFWTYNTIAGMKEQFPYMSTEQLRYSIRKLKESGLILIDKLSTDKHNNTNWYTLSAEGERVCGNCFNEAPTDFHNSDCEKAYMHFPNSDCENSQSDCENPQSLRTCNHYNITNNITNNIPPLSPTAKKVEKIKYADYVHMKENEYNALVDKFGEQTTKELISILDNYKGSKGKTYKDDYRAILSWVVKRWEDDHIVNKNNPKSFKQMEQERFLETIKEMDDLYGN